MADDNPAPVAPADDAPPEVEPEAETAPAESAAPETTSGPAKPPTKRAPAGGWAYIGPGYTPGVPARDLTADDLADLEREGWDLKALLDTGNHRASPSAAKALADPKETP